MIAKIKNLPDGAKFRRIGGTRCWEIINSSCCCDDGIGARNSYQARAIDPPERVGSASGLIGKTNEVQQYDCDWWNAEVEVEMV